MLPGSKKARNELPHQALQRVLDGELLPFSNGIVIQTSEVDVNITDSASYGISTKYLRTVHHAILKRSFPEPELVLAWSSAHQDFQMPCRLQNFDGESCTLGFYSWLSEDEFEFLKSDDGCGILEKWIAGLT